MSRRSHNRDNHSSITSPPSNSPPMRGGENSARAVKALRSAEAMKLRENLVQVYNDAIQESEFSRSRRSWPAQGRSDPAVSPRRNLPSVNALSSKRLSPQVRDELLDGARIYACVSRHARKETLFALRRIGKGKSGRNIRKAKWTDKSYLRCK